MIKKIGLVCFGFVLGILFADWLMDPLIKHKEKTAIKDFTQKNSKYSDPDWISEKMYGEYLDEKGNHA